MGKMLDSFQQGRSRRAAPPLSVAWPDEVEAAPVPAAVPMEIVEEIPFIEVGGPHEPGEIVLPASMADALPPQTARPAPEGLMTVRFHPLQVDQGAKRGAGLFAPELIAHHQPDHAISRQYRDLTTAMLVQTPMEQPRVLLFTGSSAGAGATTVVLNTAITLARHNLRRVVVVDAHFKRPAVAERLGLSASVGLREVLSGRKEIDEALQATIQPGLKAMTVGSSASAPPARLAGEAMRALLDSLREQYDLVLIDAPCWDGRPELVALGCACDAVYLCLPESVHEKPEATELMQVISEQGATLRGCVLTSR